MERKNFEKWWSENLFSDKREYEHLGKKSVCQVWMSFQNHGWDQYLKKIVLK